MYELTSPGPLANHMETSKECISLLAVDNQFLGASGKVNYPELTAYHDPYFANGASTLKPVSGRSCLGAHLSIIAP